MADPMTRIVDEVHDRYKRAEEWESTARANWRDDVKFVNADTYNRDQWPSDVWKARNAPGEAPRPTLTINRVMQHCLQITNDARQNQMSVKVNAVGFGSTSKAADAIEGICRHIEYQSNAQQNAYALATMHQVQGGIGWVHIQTDYVPGLDTFDQDIFIRAVQDPLTVFSDPDCQEPDHSDMRWAMIVEDIPREVFKSQYPEHAEIGDLAPMAGINSEWRTKDNVRTCRYYRLAENDDTLWLVPDAPAGSDGTPAVPGGPIRQSRMPAEVLEMAREEKWRSRPITERVVEWYLLAGDEVIDHGDTVFDHIPLVPWLGIEVVLDGQLDRKGHVRNLIDPQRMYNYSASAFVEHVALQTKAPWLIDERAVEGYESYWRKANVSNLPYLPWRALDPDTGAATIPVPSRVEPPAFSQAHTMGMQIADQQMQVASGQYQAEMGAPGNEKSGTAIAQRQRQADTSTYHFTDAQGAALRLIGRILIGAIPKVYDTTRAVQVLAMDGSRSGVIIDPNIDTAHKTEAPPAGPNGQPLLGPDGEPMKDILVINPTVGRFDVEADVGAGFGTRRQESWNAIVQVLQQAPEFAAKIGDLLFKAGDFPFSDEIAERLAPPSDDPNTAALNAQLQQATQAIAQLKAQLLAEKGRTDGMVAKAQADMHGASLDAANDSAQTQIARYKAETDRMGTIGSIDPEMLRPILRQLVAEEMGGQHWSQVPTVGQSGQPMGPPPGQGPNGGMSQPNGNPVPGASGPGPGGPGGPAALPRMPSTNPPGGPISSPNVSNGAVR